MRPHGHAGPIEPTSTPTALHDSPSGRVSFKLQSDSFPCPAKSFQELLESLRVKTKLNLAPSPGLHAEPTRTPWACPPLRAHVLPCRRPRGRPGSSPSRPSPAPLRPCSCLQLLPSTAQRPPCQLPSQPSSTAERLPSSPSTALVCPLLGLLLCDASTPRSQRPVPPSSQLGTPQGSAGRTHRGAALDLGLLVSIACWRLAPEPPSTPAHPSPNPGACGDPG